LYCAGVIHPNASEEHVAFIFRETELVQADAEVIRKKNVWFRGCFVSILPITGTAFKNSTVS
jgi:hypothetical protein